VRGVGKRSLRALRRIGIDNLARLRSGNHIGQIGILVLGRSGRSLPFGHAFDAALFLVLLLLPTKLLSATFFQLVAPEMADAVGSHQRPMQSGSNDLPALKNNGGGARPAPVSIDCYQRSRPRFPPPPPPPPRLPPPPPPPKLDSRGLASLTLMLRPFNSVSLNC